jgi:hypothetical protein
MADAETACPRLYLTRNTGLIRCITVPRAGDRRAWLPDGFCIKCKSVVVRPGIPVCISCQMYDAKLRRSKTTPAIIIINPK